jgi:hypothetical protein
MSPGTNLTSLLFTPLKQTPFSELQNNRSQPEAIDAFTLPGLAAIFMANRACDLLINYPFAF